MGEGRDQGQVEAIFTGGGPTGPLDEVREVDVLAGKGIPGDRYFREDGHGSFFKPKKTGQDLTLVEAEAIEGLAESGIEIEPAESRRNVLTRGIDLNALVGERFRVGEVECRGDRLCDPCSHLEKLTKPGVLKGLANRGGLRADVVSGGTIRVGDRVAQID